MEYNYAVVDDFGKCYNLCASTFYICYKFHVPIEKIDMKYLSKYYWPIPEFVDFIEKDFVGQWYSDAMHTIKE